MSTLKVQNTEEAVLKAVVKQYNALHDYLNATVTAMDGNGKAHRDITGVTSGDYLNLSSTAIAMTFTPSTPVLLSDLVQATNVALHQYNVHNSDLFAHVGADGYDASPKEVDGYAFDLPTCLAALNQLKLDYNKHVGATTSHVVVDAVNTVVAANATDLASGITLVQAIQTAYNAHVLLGPSIGKIITY